ncbi:paraquat-inducible protein A [Motilimonas cestriensis]|uniref:Paraquat-inducible protein A n=1 Tax=Motilimonas cestriensis TaxID=2742685 RepID=A0ABS8WCA8_9GAMM|nr:paraquat-inducible protein A [Motilimonas cestriensis]MCE2595898.1 paraquat-inducible protein A [Motilimonas cestriensis]
MKVTSIKNIETACEECDWLLSDTHIDSGTRLACQRCHHTISSRPKQPIEQPLAFAFASLLMLALTYSFPFMSFSASGVTLQIYFYQAMSSLIDNGFTSIATFLFLSLTLLPLLCLILIISLHLNIGHQIPNKSAIRRLKLLKKIKPWIMVDVFLVGILVALIKIMSMADVGFGLSFWAFCLFTIAFLKTLLSIDMHWLWHQHTGPLRQHAIQQSANTAKDANLARCHHCGELHPTDDTYCRRCNSPLSIRTQHSIQKTLALLIAAAVFYIPANLFPIMDTRFLGQSEPSTIIGGVILLWQLGSYPVALVIFFASVMIPIAKMLAIAWLCFTATTNRPEQASMQLKIYRVTEIIGRWSMIDVFVVAILVALVHLDGLVVVYPGHAALSFAAVVALTMLSALSFDPRIIWDPSPASEQES